MPTRDAPPLLRQSRLRLSQGFAINIIKRNAAVADFDEKVPTLLQLRVHLTQGMHYDADGSTDLTGAR